MGNKIGTIQNNSGIITQGQTGGVNKVTIHNEDKSPKRRLRDFFNLIDPRIVKEVAAGKRELLVRMQPFDINQLQTLVAEEEISPIVTITGFGRRFLLSQISNGSLGPSSAVEEQTEVKLSFKTNSLD